MSGYPNHPPPQNFSYPQHYNPTNAPPPQYPGPGYPGYAGGQPIPGQPMPGQPMPGQPMPGQMMQGQMPGQYVPQPGFMYAYPNQGAPNIAPTPSAPPSGYPGYAGVTPPQPTYGSMVEWVPTTPAQAIGLNDRAIVAGYEGHDGSPIWVIRAHYQGDLIPGKLAIKHRSAYVPWGGKENPVQNIEVCCAPAERIKWVQTRDGNIPPNAIPGGNTASGEPLYVGRAKEQGSLTPGKVQPSHKVMYMSFAGNEIPHSIYEIMCSA